MPTGQSLNLQDRINKKKVIYPDSEIDAFDGTGESSLSTTSMLAIASCKETG